MEEVVSQILVDKMASHTMTPQKKKVTFDLSKISCSYCKEEGHRIHAVGSNGIYVKGKDGERVLACPVLIAKEERKAAGPVALKKPVRALVQVQAINNEADFPALSATTAQAPAPATAFTWSSMVAANLSPEDVEASSNSAKEVQALSDAIANKKREKYLEIKAQKEQKKRYWEEHYSKRMYSKYGPTWYWCVNKTADDNDFAASLRSKEEEEERQREDDYYYIQSEINRKIDLEWEQEQAEREVRRSQMTDEERWEEEHEYMDELEHGLWSATMDDEGSTYYYKQSMLAQKAQYEANGWPWPPATS